MVKLLKLKFGQDSEDEFCSTCGLLFDQLVYDLKAVSLVKALNPWVRCDFGNVYIPGGKIDKPNYETLRHRYSGYCVCELRVNKRFHCVVEGSPERILTGPETWEEAVRHPQFPHFLQSQINFLAFCNKNIRCQYTDRQRLILKRFVNIHEKLRVCKPNILIYINTQYPNRFENVA